MENPLLSKHLALAREAEDLFPGAVIEQTNDLLQIDLRGREEGSILLLFLPDALEIRHRVVRWPSTHTPLLGSKLWKRVKYGRLDGARLLRLCRRAETEWTEGLGTCVHCRKVFPAERTVEVNGRRCCHECAERHEQVVF